MTQPGIEPRCPGPLANTLTARPKDRYVNIIALTELELTYYDVALQHVNHNGDSSLMHLNSCFSY